MKNFDKISVCLEAPINLWRCDMLMFTKLICIGDHLRLFNGVISDESTEPTHRVERITKPNPGQCKIWMSDGRHLKTLRFASLTAMAMHSFIERGKAFKDWLTLHQELSTIECTIHQHECNLALPKCVHDHISHLTKELDKRINQMQTHERYFAEIGGHAD